MHLLKPAFTLPEMLVSVAVMGILAVTVMSNLNSGKQTEELRTAANQLVADIRSMQARALAAGEVKACPKADGKMAICENSTTMCLLPANCIGHVPSSFGIHASTTNTGYVLFAEEEPSKADYKYSGQDETLIARTLLQGSSQDVVIQNIYSDKPAVGFAVSVGDISFTRQNGVTRMFDGTTEPDVITIRLKQKQSNVTKDVVINRITGRVSIEN